jgi:hypothetical protein
MAEQAFPFGTGAGASITEAQFQVYLRNIIGDGVSGVGGLLACSAGSGMASNVATGSAFLTGLYYNNDATKAVTHGTADPTNDRIDLIVVHLNLTASTDGAGVTAKSGSAIILAGTPAGSPVAPSVTQNANMWEIALYQVRVHHGDVASSSFAYTDARSFAHADIPSGTISTAMLQNNAVTAAKMANGTVTATQIANATITGTQIASAVALAGNPTGNGNTLGQLKSAGGGAAGVVTWEGTTDPAGSASEGDLWIVG